MRKKVVYSVYSLILLAMLAYCLIISATAKAETPFRIEAVMETTDPETVYIEIYNEDTERTFKLVAKKKYLKDPAYIDAIVKKSEEEIGDVDGEETAPASNR